MSSINREYLRVPESELRELMEIFDIDHDSTVQELKACYRKKMNESHPDKGGDEEVAKTLTRGMRILEHCINYKRPLPVRIRFTNHVPKKKSKPIKTKATVFSVFRSDSEPEDEFEEVQSKYKKAKMTRKENTKKTSFPTQSDTADGVGSQKNKKSRDKRPTRRYTNYINGYVYEDEDDYDICVGIPDSYDQDIPEWAETSFQDSNGFVPTGKDSEEKTESKRIMKTIRGGLKLFDDLSNSILLPEVYIAFSQTDMTVDDLKGKKEFEPILNALKDPHEELDKFSDKLEAFVFIDWAFLEKEAGNSFMDNVRLQPLSNSMENPLFSIDISFEAYPYEIDEDFLAQGDVILVRPHRIGNQLETLNATAIIEEFDSNQRILTVSFFPGRRFMDLIEFLFSKNHPPKAVELLRNNSVFLHRTYARAIENIRRNVGDVMLPMIYPRPTFDESYDEFFARQTYEMDFMQFSNTEQFNDLQKRAIHTILNGEMGTSPFILWGPPGTGKTVTLIESVHQIVKNDPANRVLICTPSRMAADVVASGLIERGVIESKYIFRMHSQSANARMRDERLDPIVYIPRETRGKFYGIPPRKNLRVFRVIICTLSTSSYLVSAGGFGSYFSHIIIDEAGQATEQETWIPIGGLASAKTRLVLCGDPEQLGPVVTVHFTRDFGYDHSMISRLKAMECYENDKRLMIMLEESYRASLNVIRPSSYLFYSDKLRSNVPELTNEFLEWAHKRRELRCRNKEDDKKFVWCPCHNSEFEACNCHLNSGFPIIFHATTGGIEVRPEGSKSIYNLYEIELVKDYVDTLLDETDLRPSEIGVISPYKYQTRLLKGRLRDHVKKRLLIDSVEGFQGSERKVIIMTTARTRSLGFLACDRRLNTSISRAKCLLIVLGTPELLVKYDSWKKFIHYCCCHRGYVKSHYPHSLTRIINSIEATAEHLAQLEFNDGAEPMEIDDDEEDYHHVIDLRD